MKFHFKIKYLLILIGILLVVVLTISTNILNKNSHNNSSSKQSQSKLHRHTDKLISEPVATVETAATDKPVASDEPVAAPTFRLVKNIILIPEKSYNRSFAGKDIVFRLESVNNSVQVKMLDSKGNFEKNMDTFKQNIKNFEKNFTILFSNWLNLFRNSKETDFPYPYDDIFQPFILLVGDHNILLNRNTVLGINTIKASKDFLNLCSLLFLDANKQIDEKVTKFWLKIFEITNVL
jgi:hypothetical protein